MKMLSNQKKDTLLDYIPSITSAAYIILANVVELLKPLYELTVILEKRDITMGMAYLQFKKAIFEIKSIYSKLINDFALDIQKNLEDRLKKMNNDCKYPLICCILDPRVKPFIISKYVGFTEKELLDAKDYVMELNCDTERVDIVSCGAILIDQD